jgi:hypothetical protein
VAFLAGAAFFAVVFFAVVLVAAIRILHICCGVKKLPH